MSNTFHVPEAVELILHEHGPPYVRQLERHHPGDVGFDLAAVRSYTVDPGEFIDIETGVRLSMPAGIWARIVGRSSTLRKRGLLVAEGIIDTGYQGLLFVGVYNPGRRPVEVAVGDRFAQVIFQRAVIPRFETVAEFSTETSRGAGGFGSTGGKSRTGGGA